MQISVIQQTIGQTIHQIELGELDLQADFQRREVWPIKKKQRLIDSIVRGWQIPSIHLLQPKDYESSASVLDGQQRLVAIRDFMHERLTFDGNIPPGDFERHSLDGHLFSSFPLREKRRFTDYVLTVVRIEDYDPEEVAELFYRLNQGTRLTAAEHRNSFHGPVGKQIRDLATEFENLTNGGRSGIGNLRMMYDDVLAHVAKILVDGSLWIRVTPNLIGEMYRLPKPLPFKVFDSMRRAIHTVAPAVRLAPMPIKFSKASLFSWLLFSIRVDLGSVTHAENLIDFIIEFETVRQTERHVFSPHSSRVPENQLRQLMEIFSHRCSSRIFDVPSVVLRDLVIWLVAHATGRLTDFRLRNRQSESSIKDMVTLLQEYEFVSDDLLVQAAEAVGWGSHL
ncbi:DUF262 domain-containing protein [Burkholderia cenocepacia]|uniref:DUF262 domain-containing protein n=1 Tax=Burkholderia cenocepacia TaxID=95486 RepID=UPI00222E2747|nr:DUF262 domain-containing protein [Burkholderia cenocepacia]MCW3607533.1 DUF262 domain-containing protein [Burkholderia cenocepacia]MCW5189306.1 DUF262 domain-containing protein [Burkholderia cenocepacia]